MFPVVGVDTALVVIWKLALDAFCATVTFAGTCAAEFVLPRSTDSAAGVDMFSVTVPVDDCGPVTTAGFTLTDCRAGPDSAGAITLSHHIAHEFAVAEAYSCTVQKSVSLTGSTCVAL